MAEEEKEEKAEEESVDEERKRVSRAVDKFTSLARKELLEGMGATRRGPLGTVTYECECNRIVHDKMLSPDSKELSKFRDLKDTFPNMLTFRAANGKLKSIPYCRIIEVEWIEE